MSISFPQIAILAQHLSLVGLTCKISIEILSARCSGIISTQNDRLLKLSVTVPRQPGVRIVCEPSNSNT